MATGAESLGGDDSLLTGLRDLQKYVAQLQGVISTAREAAPPRASAHDVTGVAVAEIDAEGAPTSLKISQGWASSLSADQLGPALVEAYQTAVQQHMQEWSDDLSRQGWQFDARDFNDKVAQAPTPQHDLFDAPTGPAHSRDVSSIVEDVLGELDEAHSLAAAPPPPPPSSPSPTGRVAVSIHNNALTAVHVDPEWATGQDAASINQELAHALQSARLHQEHQPAGSLKTGRLDDLFAEVLQAMTNQRTEK